MNRNALDAYVTAVLATAPPISDQRREELTRALRPGTRKGQR